MASVRTRLVLTLFYSWCFHFPLRVEEWLRRLYRSSGKDAGHTTHQLLQEVTKLVEQKKLVLIDGYFAPHSTHENLAVLRADRKQFSQRKRDELAPLINFCRRLPWVVGLAITGSVAVENAQENDDTDVMIVCAHNRLWIVRPLLIFFSQLYGKRRTWRGEEGNSWCFNLWLEQYSQRVPPSQQSLYTAYEVCQASWVLSKQNTRQLFLDANTWAGKRVPVLFLTASKSHIPHEDLATSISVPVWCSIIDIANYILFSMQHMYMRRHMTRERVSLHFAAFHPRDTAKKIITSLREIVATSL